MGKTGAMKNPPAGLEDTRRLFQEAGAVRDRWMELQLLSKLEGLPENISGPCSAMEAETRLGFMTRATTHLEKLQQLVQAPDPGFGKIRNRTLEKLYRKQLQKLAVSLSQKGLRERLHPCRKKIKRLMILYAIHGEESMDLRPDLKYMDQLQDQIGKWHDTEMVLKILPNTREIIPIRKKLEVVGAGQLARAVSLASGFQNKALSKGRI